MRWLWRPPSDRRWEEGPESHGDPASAFSSLRAGLGHQPSDFFFVERKRNPRGWRHRSLWFLLCASRLSLYVRHWARMSLCWVWGTWQALCPVTPRRLRCSEIKQCTQCHMDLPAAVTYSWRPPQRIQLFNYCQKYDTRSHPKPNIFFSDQHLPTAL